MINKSKNNNLLTSGWLQSGELIALARPMALLLAMLLTFSVYLNAAIAAGSDNVLCRATVSSQDENSSGTSKYLSGNHCPLCIISLKYPDPGSPSQFLLAEAFSVGIQQQDFADARLPHQSDSRFNIRAPPYS